MKTLEKGTTARVLAAQQQRQQAASAPPPQTIRSYTEADAALRAGVGDRRKLANNTYLVRRESGEIAVMLHETDVVTYYRGGSAVKFDSGGWRTSTTRERINSYSPAEVSQQGGVWLITANGETRTFADGIIWWTGDDPVLGMGWTSVGPPVADLLALRDRIKSYVERFMQRFDSDDGVAPGPGDCWFCLFNSGDNAIQFGTPSTDHLQSHMDEGYFVPSLVATAVKRYPVSDVARLYLRAKWHLSDSLIASTTERVGRAQVKASLTKYLLAQFGLGGK